MKIKFADVAKSLRKTWGEFNPTNRVVKSKKQYSRREKFKNSDF